MKLTSNSNLTKVLFTVFAILAFAVLVSFLIVIISTNENWINKYQTLIGSIFAVFAAAWAGGKALQAAREQIHAVDKRGRNEQDLQRKTLANMLVREIRMLSEFSYQRISKEPNEQYWNEQDRREQIKFFPLPQWQKSIFEEFRIDLIAMSVDGEISTTGVDWIEDFYSRIRRLSKQKEANEESMISVGDFNCIFIEAYFSFKYLRRVADLPVDITEHNIRVLMENTFGISENFKRTCLELDPEKFVRSRFIKNYQYSEICETFGRRLDDEVAKYGHGGIWYESQ